ncbi:phage tail family protein [bacterium LRH843]|nr:phage tail family protein [bacterium LRH843]
MKRQMKYTNSRGESITFNSVGSSFGANNITGLGDVDADIQTQKAPYQHGSTPIDVVLESRPISFDAVIFGKGDTDISNKRKILSKVFNPILGEGVLEMRYGDNVYMINAIAEHVPKFGTGFENRGRRHQVALIDLICPDPFWEEIITTTVKLEDFVASFRFPFHLPAKFSARGDTRIIVNEGHVDTSIVVEFRGEAINPVITNQTTGEFIKVNRAIPSDHRLIIKTAPDDMTVEIIDPDNAKQDAFSYIDLESTFFSLNVGENKLSFLTEGGKPEVYIKYKNKFLGV